MIYVTGALVGAAIGCIVGWLKGILIWRKYVNESEAQGDPSGEASRVYPRMMISYAVNIGTLVLLFLLRNVVPFNAVAFVVGGATGLVVMNFVMASRRKA